jgi:hypothetical protein
LKFSLIGTQNNDTSTKPCSILQKFEYPFLTLQQYPIGFIRSICGVVCARSVKLHTSTTTTQQTNESNFGNNLRDKWFIEIRNEIRTQMKSLECNIVLGYTETKSICEDVCIISAMGTACVCDEAFFQHHEVHMNSEEYFKLFDDPKIKNCSLCHMTTTNLAQDEIQTNNGQEDKQEEKQTDVQRELCGVCSRSYVPDVLFLTIQPIPELYMIGNGCLLKAVVSRPLKKCSAETNAKIISDCLPFMEYELHKQLLNKIKLNGI